MDVFHAELELAFQHVAAAHFLNHMALCTMWQRPICFTMWPYAPHQGLHIEAQTLKWSKVPEDSSDFDDSWTELIVTT